MRIGELAGKAGVNIQTIRFYEREQLLREPLRTASGYRSYTAADLESVRFIKQCQCLGFTLKEVRQLLQLHTAIARLPSPRNGRKSGEWVSFTQMTAEKLGSIREKIELLRSMEKQLAGFLRELQRKPAPDCPASRMR